MWAVIRNFAVVGPEQATRERLKAALAAAPNISVYRIGRGADPLPVSATFDPADQPGCRSVLDWFERGAPAGSVLLLDDWELCADLDPGLGRTVEWIAAFGPAQGVQTVVTARKWTDVPQRLRRCLHGEATDFLALHGIEPDLSNKYQRRDLRTAVGGDSRGWPVYLHIDAHPGDGFLGSYTGPPAQREQKLLAALLGLVVTHSPADLNIGCFDMADIGVFDGLEDAPHTAFSLDGGTPDEVLLRFQSGLDAELGRRQDLVHQVGKCRNFHDYRAKVDAGEELEPLAALLICLDSAELLLERLPGFRGTLDAIAAAGRVLGMYLLYSGDAFPEGLRASRSEDWPFAEPPHDLEEWAEVLPRALTGTGPPARQIVFPPLHESSLDLKQDDLPPGAIGLVDLDREQRSPLVPSFHAERRFGVIVGKSGSGKTTALRALARALGDDLPKYQLLDGPGEQFDPERFVVITARSWDEVPSFVWNTMSFVLEFRLDNPARSMMDDDLAAAVPDLPGHCLAFRLDYWPKRYPAQIALP
jgi:hypothetical protein